MGDKSHIRLNEKDNQTSVTSVVADVDWFLLRFAAETEPLSLVFVNRQQIQIIKLYSIYL